MKTFSQSEKKGGRPEHFTFSGFESGGGRETIRSEGENERLSERSQLTKVSRKGKKGPCTSSQSVIRNIEFTISILPKVSFLAE